LDEVEFQRKSPVGKSHVVRGSVGVGKVGGVAEWIELGVRNEEGKRMLRVWFVLESATRRRRTRNW
jgi:hypothetical protein